MPRRDGNTKRPSKGYKRRMSKLNMRRWMAELERMNRDKHNEKIAVQNQEAREEWAEVKRQTGWGSLPLRDQPYWSPPRNGTWRSEGSPTSSRRFRRDMAVTSSGEATTDGGESNAKRSATSSPVSEMVA